MTTNNQIPVRWPETGTTIKTESKLIYTIGNILSDAGHFGKLYDGHDSFFNPVAIKILKPANRQFQDVEQQWEKEISILNKVRHPNVIFIHDAFVCDNLFYIVFEKAWGSLFDLIKTQGPLTQDAVKEIARQLLFALHYIHRDRVLHKDLTPYNILHFEKGICKISDFGISEEFIDQSHSFNQTAHHFFKPPELIKAGYTTFQSDLYHLGMVLYFCLTGQFPYDANLPQAQIDYAILSGVPRLKAEQLNSPLGNFISILLRRRQEYRFQNEIEAWEYLWNI